MLSVIHFSGNIERVLNTGVVFVKAQWKSPVEEKAVAGRINRGASQSRSEIWQQENAKAFECWNAYVKQNGLPLGKYWSQQ